MTGESTPEMTPGINPGQVPLFHQISDCAFQNLCRDLFDEEETISTCDIYGVSGEGQYGIDLIATRKDGDGIEVGQCKCYKDFPPKEIRDVSKEFFKHWETHWAKCNIKRFILFVASSLDKRRRQDEILNQKNHFLRYGIAYEVWSAAHIRNKLRPHRGIVQSYCYPPEYWITEICGIPISTSPFGGNTSTQAITQLALENQISQLSGQVSENTAEQLISMRKARRAGHTSKVIKWLESLRNGNWSFLSPEVKADVLLLEAVIELEENHDISRARELADEALIFMPSQNQVHFRTLIIYHESGPDEALEAGLLDNQDDIDSLNLKAALLLESGHIEESLEILDLKDE